jgi:hypothetical protein
MFHKPLQENFGIGRSEEDLSPPFHFLSQLSIILQISIVRQRNFGLHEFHFNGLSVDGVCPSGSGIPYMTDAQIAL